MRRIILAGLVAGWLLTSGCHVGLMGIYGCTGEQRHKGRLIVCPGCGGSHKIDRLRLFAPCEPILPLITHDWYCQECKTWWRTRGWCRYQRGPGWPWGD